MFLEIKDIQVATINSHLINLNRVAERASFNSNLIIVGVNEDTKGCVAIKLYEDPCTNKLIWCVGYFKLTAPKELTNGVETSETPDTHKTENWDEVLRLIIDGL